MFLSRTRQKLVHGLRGFIFDKAGVQEFLDIRDKQRLEDLMGFRGQFDEHRRFQFAFLRDRGLMPHNTLLDIGCGPLTAGIPIIEYLQTGNYVGIDVRSSVLDMSWKEVGKAGLSAKNPRLICSTSFGSAELGEQSFDFILSFSVLYHLSDEMLKLYFAAVHKRLKPRGVCIANINTITGSSTWLEFPFLKRTIEVYRTGAAEYGLEVTALGEIGDLGFRLAGLERHNQMLAFQAR